VHDRAVVFPGRSLAGKTTLVAEMIRQGAEYLSDDFALFDLSGHVYPYARPLVMRLPGGRRRRVPAVELGARQVQDPLPVGTIVFTEYELGGSWNPVELSRGQAALRLLDNTVSARRNPEMALRVIRLVTEGTSLLHGPRGEAADVARRLMGDE
jgi:hypothetical protein